VASIICPALSLGYDRLRDTGVLDRVQVFTTDLMQPIPEGRAG
jgi:hypothetical protein